MLTLAGLLERRNRVEEARELFEAVAKRYPGPRERSLAAFYYRQAVIAKRAEYVDLWKNTEQALFPGGLKPTPVTMANQPAKGIFVDRDSTESRKVRLQAGDIIVGVDGFQVENEAQFATVMAFGGADAPHKFTAWRGVLFTVELPADHGMTLKGYPLVGLVP